MKNVHVNKLMLGGLYVVWSIPVANFVINPSYSPQTWPVWLAMGVTLLFTMADRRFFALAIPFVAMFSPLAHSDRVMGLLPSEIFLGYCALSWLLIFLIINKNHVNVLPGDAYLIGLVLISFLSYLLSFEHAALLPSLLNWIALIIVFAVTRTTLRSTGLMPVYFLSLLVVAGFASALIVTGFVNGMPLVNLMTDSDNVFVDREKVQSLFRASYFYANIFYLLGAAAVVSLVAIFTANKNIYKVISSGFLVAMLSTLFIMFAKTALVALMVCLFILVLLSFSIRRLTHKHRGVAQSLFIIFPSVLLLFVLSQITGTSDYYKFSTDSFTERLAVVSSSFEILLQQPERLLFGFGPDASTRISNEATDAARSSSSGIEGAIDSAYITFLFDYGLVFVVLFSLFGVHTLLRLLRLIKRNPQPQPILINLFGVIIFFYIAAISQVIGTSKVAWVIVQIFALAGICLSRNIKDRRRVQLHT